MPSSLRRSVVARNQKLAVSQGEPLDGSLVIYRFGPVKQMRGYVKRMLTTFKKLSTLRGGLRPNSVFALVPYRSGGTRPMAARDWNLAPAGGHTTCVKYVESMKYLAS